MEQEVPATPAASRSATLLTAKWVIDSIHFRLISDRDGVFRFRRVRFVTVPPSADLERTVKTLLMGHSIGEILAELTQPRNLPAEVVDGLRIFLGELQELTSRTGSFRPVPAVSA